MFSLRPQIADFGVSQLRSGCPSELLHQTAAIGTYHWMAPEILLAQPYNEKVDVYSFGILLYEIFSESIPYSASPTASPRSSNVQSPVNLALCVAQGQRPDLSRISRRQLGTGGGGGSNSCIGPVM